MQTRMNEKERLNANLNETLKRHAPHIANVIPMLTTVKNKRDKRDLFAVGNKRKIRINCSKESAFDALEFMSEEDRVNANKGLANWDAEQTHYTT